MKILLTGSEGFVGTMFQKSLSNENHEVICLDKVVRDKSNYFCHDLSDSNNFELINELRGFNFDILIHLAAAKGDYNLGYNDFYRDNVIASSELVKIIESLNIKSVIMYSTVSVYGHNNQLKSEAADLKPNNPYGETKLESENIFIKWFNLNSTENQLTILRPSVIYGENNYANMYNLLNQLNRKLPLTIGSGNYIKSMISVENIIDITIFCSKRMKGIQIYNCTEAPYPKLKEVINYISDIDGFRKPVLSLPKWMALMVGLFFEILSFMVQKDLGITRERIHKFTMPTDYRSERLRDIGYVQNFSIKDRIQNMAKWYLKIKKQK
jgi:GlcNAc-P-P-Und epimerase